MQPGSVCEMRIVCVFVYKVVGQEIRGIIAITSLIMKAFAIHAYLIVIIVWQRRYLLQKCAQLTCEVAYFQNTVLHCVWSVHHSWFFFSSSHLPTLLMLETHPYKLQHIPYLITTLLKGSVLSVPVFQYFTKIVSEVNQELCHAVRHMLMWYVSMYENTQNCHACLQQQIIPTRHV